MATNNAVNTSLSGQTGTGSFAGSTAPAFLLPSANNFLEGFTTTATAAGTTVLTVNSNHIQEFTGVTTQTVTLPVTSTLTVGQTFYIINNSTGVVTVQSSGANTIQALAANSSLIVTCILTSGTTAASWNGSYIVDTGGGVSPGTANQIAYYAATGNVISGLTGANSSMLVTNVTGVPAMTASMTDGQVIVGSTGATPVPATLTAGTGISITNAAGSITVAATGSGESWVEVTGTSQALAINTGYIANNVGLVTLTLPLTAAQGSVITIVGKGAGGWKIAQNASQLIHLGSSVTTTGVGGSLASTNQWDVIEIVCITADTTWSLTSAPQGNITVV